MKPRSWLAVSAWFRNSAGRMKSKSEKKKHHETRSFKHNLEEILDEAKRETEDENEENNEQRK